MGLSRQQMVELIGLGIIITDPKKLADLDANCWDGPLRSVITELQRLLDDPRNDTAPLRRLIDSTLHVWWEDGKLSDALIERLKEFGEFRKAQRCGGEIAWNAHQKRAERELERKRARTSRGT